MKVKPTLILSAAMMCGVIVESEAAESPALTPDPGMARPIDRHDSVFIEELTWIEVRDALREGKRTVLVATGGVEMNGPYLVTGKHNYVLRTTTEAIARKLGNALVAPIVPFVPEGDIDPPSGHMRYPGTISVREETFRQLLTDIAESLRTHGFEEVVLIGDSGGNQEGMKAVAAELASKWKGARIRYIPEFYESGGRLKQWLDGQGIRQTDEGLHDDFGVSATLVSVDPELVRLRQRAAKGKATINGVSLLPVEKSRDLGKRAVEFRAQATVEAIRKPKD